jgi:hypothetical protein
MEAESGDTAIETSTAGFTCTFTDPVTPPLAAVTVADPTLSAVTSPVALTVAIELSEELQTALLEMSFVVSSEYVAMAVSCSVVPFASDGCKDVTSIDAITAGLTVRTVVPLTPAELAAMVVVPVVSVWATPRVGLVIPIVATVGFEELQLTLAVRSWILPSANVPVAVNGCVSPSGTEGMAGVTAMETSADRLTVSVVEPAIDPDTAAIVADPVPLPRASPELSIVAIPVLEEIQSTEPVRSCVLPSV